MSTNDTGGAKNPCPPLREIPLSSVVIGPGVCTMTINVGAWDGLIKAAWERRWILIEIENERAVRAFQKGEA